MWEMKLDFQDGSEQMVVSNAYLSSESFSPKWCVGAKGEHQAQSLQMRIYSKAVAARLAAFRKQIKACLYKDGAPYFTGIIRPNVSISVSGTYEEPVSVELLDYSELMHQYVYSADQVKSLDGGGYIQEQTFTGQLPFLDSQDISASILGRLFALVGITDIASEIDIPSQGDVEFDVPAGSYIDKLINDICYQFLVDYRFLADGSAVFFSTEPPVAIPSQTIGTSDLVNSFQFRKSDDDTDGTTIEYSAYKEAKHLLVVPEAGYSRQSGNLLSIWREWKEPEKTVYWDFSCLPADGDKNKTVVAVENITLGYDTSEGGGHESDATFSISSHDLEKCVFSHQVNVWWEWVGAWIKARLYADVRWIQSGFKAYGRTGKNPKTYTSDYVHAYADAKRLGDAMYRYIIGSQHRYAFESFNCYEPGTFWSLSEASVSGIGQTVRILSCKFNVETSVYTYEAEGIDCAEITAPPNSLEMADSAAMEFGGAPGLTIKAGQTIFSENSDLYAVYTASGYYIEYYHLPVSWTIDDTPIPAGQLLGVDAIRIPVQSVSVGNHIIKCSCDISSILPGEPVAMAASRLSVVGDGKDGKPGPQGGQGPAGADGADAKLLRITCDVPAFRLDKDGEPYPGQVATLNALKQNITDALQWHVPNHSYPPGTTEVRLTPADMGHGKVTLKNLISNSADDWVAGTTGAYQVKTLSYGTELIVGRKYFMRCHYKYATTNQSPTWAGLYSQCDSVIPGPLSFSRKTNPIVDTEYKLYGMANVDSSYSLGYGTVFNGDSNAVNGVTGYVKKDMCVDITDLVAMYPQRLGSMTDAQLAEWCDTYIPDLKSGESWTIGGTLRNILNMEDTWENYGVDSYQWNNSTKILSATTSNSIHEVSCLRKAFSDNGSEFRWYFRGSLRQAGSVQTKFEFPGYGGVSLLYDNRKTTIPTNSFVMGSLLGSGLENSAIRYYPFYYSITYFGQYYGSSSLESKESICCDLFYSGWLAQLSLYGIEGGGAVGAWMDAIPYFPASMEFPVLESLPVTVTAGEHSDGTTVSIVRDGAEGRNASFTRHAYRAASSVPPTPSGDSSSIPTGWDESVPVRDAGQTIYVTSAVTTWDAGNAPAYGPWSAPSPWSGDKGDAGAPGPAPIIQYRYSDKSVVPPQGVSYVVSGNGNYVTWNGNRVAFDEESSWGESSAPLPGMPFKWMRVSLDNGTTWKYSIIEQPVADFFLEAYPVPYGMSSRNVVKTAQTVMIACDRQNTSGATSWSVNRGLAIVPSGDGATATVTIPVGFGYTSFTVTCSVARVGTKTIQVNGVPAGAYAPMFLGKLEPAPTTTAEGPLMAGDSYLRADNIPQRWDGYGWNTPTASDSNYAFIMSQSLNAVLADGTDVTQSMASLYAWIGELAAKSATIQRLFAKNVTVGNGDGTASSGFRFRAHQYDANGNLLAAPIFDIMYGDRTVWKVVPSTGKIFFGQPNAALDAPLTGFMYDPSTDTIRTANDKVVIDSTGKIVAVDLQATNAVISGIVNATDGVFTGSINSTGLKVLPATGGTTYSYPSSSTIYAQAFDWCNNLTNLGLSQEVLVRGGLSTDTDVAYVKYKSGYKIYEVWLYNTSLSQLYYSRTFIGAGSPQYDRIPGNPILSVKPSAGQIIKLIELPTSSLGLEQGQVYSDNGVLKIAL